MTPETPPPRIFLLSPAHCGGKRAELLLGGRGRLRRLEAHGLTEVPSTRLLVTTARLIAAGISPRDACRAAMAAPLTDEPELLAAMEALVTATF